MAQHDDGFLEPIEGIRVSRRGFNGYFAKMAMVLGPGAALLSACGGDDDSDGSRAQSAPLSSKAQKLLDESRGQSVAGVVSTLAIEFYVEWDKGAKAAAEALGLEWHLNIDDFDIQKVQSIIDSEISKNTQMFVTSSLAAANEPVIAKAVGQGGGTLINNYNIPDFYTPFDSGDSHAAWLLPNEILGAEQLTAVVIEKAGGKGNFVHITGDPTTPVDWRRTLGVDNALKKYPDAKLVARAAGNWDRVKSRQVMADMLVQQGNKIDGVFCQNDDTAIGALPALQDAGLDVPIFGMDGVGQALELVEAGQLTATLQVYPSWIGGYNVVQLFDAFHGFKRTDAERMMQWAGTPLTQDGGGDSAKVSSYQDKVNDFDWALMSRVLHPDDWDPQNLLYPLDPADIWRTRPKPAGWKNPMQKSIDSGEFSQVKQMYAEHYKKKII